MFPQNLHTHTTFGDGKHTPEEMARGALRAGCRSLGFSEHSYMPPATGMDGWTMGPEREPAYRAEVLRLRRAFEGRLEVFLGLELDVDSPAPRERYDYIIGSAHGIWRDGVYLSADESREGFVRGVREHFGGDYYAFAAACYRRAAEVPARTGCQIAGHFDLVSKFNEGGRYFDESDPRYRNAALEALEAAMERDPIFEINTGAMSRGYRSAPYPAPFLLRALRERGGRVCISADAHSAADVVHAFPQAAALAESCGFRAVWVLTGEGWREAGVENWRG